MKQISIISIIALSLLVFLTNCEKTKELSDLDKTAALRNVTVTYDAATYNIGVPNVATGKSFSELRKTSDSTKILDPANYTISFAANMKTANTKTDAEDAKFESSALNIVMDTLKSTPLKAVAEGFEVKKAETVTTPISGSVNLKTHKKAGLYIFTQTLAGFDLSTTLTPSLGYNIGSYKGFIDFISIQQNIPTRASEETKAFIRDAIAAGVFK